jgi:hypothetical protein
MVERGKMDVLEWKKNREMNESAVRDSYFKRLIILSNQFWKNSPFF